MNQIRYCKICGKILSGKQKLFCGVPCKNKAHQSYPSQQKRGFERKISLVEEFGGRCAMCGYKRNTSALTFHHLEPSKKQFTLDLRSLSNRTEAKIRNELKKCILICHNCHAEIHNPQHNLGPSTSSRLL